jgi:hypothetical protein
MATLSATLYGEPDSLSPRAPELVGDALASSFAVRPRMNSGRTTHTRTNAASAIRRQLRALRP